MARYIDADKLTNKMFPIGLVDNGNYTINAKAVKAAIDRTPTADVMPKSETAREIFDEIEKIIDEKYNHYIFGNNDLDDLEHEAIINYSDDLSSSFDELKKKYTEGQ